MYRLNPVGSSMKRVQWAKKHGCYVTRNMKEEKKMKLGLINGTAQWPFGERHLQDAGQPTLHPYGGKSMHIPPSTTAVLAFISQETDVAPMKHTWSQSFEGSPSTTCRILLPLAFVV
ncbi:unnamed protein product [Arctogadus glacialis]